MRCHIIPPHITSRLPLPDRPADLSHDETLRGHRQLLYNLNLWAEVGVADVEVYDAQHRQATTSRLPCVDAAAAHIRDGLAAAHTLWAPSDVDVYPATAFAHYGRGYDNAFWDGSVMCFGDGDGRYFGDFAKPVDVAVHERTHGITGTRLNYAGQAGALNESMSDVAGIVAKQRTPGADNWLIGEGLLLESGARGLRDMLNPGTAYDTPALGKDPQPGHMEHYVDTTDDDGGVHINSGIPNRAFALAASSLPQGTERIWNVWADVLLHAAYRPDCTFEQWAQLTVDRSAGDLRAAIVVAWAKVGIGVEYGDAPPPAPKEWTFRLSPALASKVLASAHLMGSSPDEQLEHIVSSYYRKRVW